MNFFALLLITFIPIGVFADPLEQAVTDEMNRALSRLSMSGLPGPYFVSQAVSDTTRYELEASFGAIRTDNDLRYRNLRLDLRVGSPQFDNTHFIGEGYWSDGPYTSSLVVEDDYDALRFFLWKAHDSAYKTALERFSHKTAFRQQRMIRDLLFDLTPAPVEVFKSRPERTPFSKDEWRRRLEKLSAIFKDHPSIQHSKTAFYWTETDEHIYDSEGRRIVRPKDDYELYAVAGAQAADGMRLMNQRRFVVQNPAHLPPYTLLEAEVIDLARELSELAGAEAVDEEYVGPVLFEGQAAGEFFHQLFARNISGEREIWVESDSAQKHFAPGELVGRKGLRVMSPMLSAEDDASLTQFQGTPLIGHYRFDDQGVPARRISVVERGILKDFPVGRSPGKKSTASNGHARGAFWENPTARISNLIISAEKTASLTELREDLRRRAREFGLDHAYVARRLLLSETSRGDERLSAPILLYKVDAVSGKETLVRNAKFSGVTLRALRDVAGASHRRHVHNFYQIGPNELSQGQIQASIVHPSILISEMSIKRSERKPEKLPVLKHPFFD